MAGAVTVTRKWGGMGSTKMVGTIALSGNYAAGGEAIVWPKPGTTKDPYVVLVQGSSGYVYAYDYVAKKLKIFVVGAAGALTELATAAYPAGVTGDVIRFMTEWPRLG